MESANPTSLQPGEPFNPYGLFNGIFIPEAICKFRGLSLGAKVVYGRLYRFAGKDGKAYPSVPTLGAEVGISAKQARRYVRELEDQRFIRSERTTGRQNHYLFLWHTAFIGESGQPRKAPLPKMGVPTPPMNGSTTPPEDGSQRESGERESPTRESAKTDYQRTNRTNRDSHAGARGDAIDEPSENQTPRPKPSSSERIQFTQEEREWMSGALDSYGQSHHEKILRFSHLPRTGNGPLSLTWQTARTRMYPRFLLTSQKIKLTDTRAAGFKREFGADAPTVELDALPVNELRLRIENAVKSLVDREIWNRQIAIQDIELNCIKDFAERMKNLPQIGG